MEQAQPPLPRPRQGEIWFVQFPTDPPNKRPRPVVIVSLDRRNENDLAQTVLAAPLTTTLKEPMPRTHIRLGVGETGLQEQGELQAENITTVAKASLRKPQEKLRQLSTARIRQIAGCVILAMGVFPSDLAKP
jgi:mRNA-degrading endonuclease toxin of MazEF toxin-antitoxin module